MTTMHWTSWLLPAILTFSPLSAVTALPSQPDSHHLVARAPMPMPFIPFDPTEANLAAIKLIDPPIVEELNQYPVEKHLPDDPSDEDDLDYPANPEPEGKGTSARLRRDPEPEAHMEADETGELDKRAPVGASTMMRRLSLPGGKRPPQAFWDQKLKHLFQPTGLKDKWGPLFVRWGKSKAEATEKLGDVEADHPFPLARLRNMLILAQYKLELEGEGKLPKGTMDKLVVPFRNMATYKTVKDIPKKTVEIITSISQNFNIRKEGTLLNAMPKQINSLREKVTVATDAFFKPGNQLKTASKMAKGPRWAISWARSEATFLYGITISHEFSDQYYKIAEKTFKLAVTEIEKEEHRTVVFDWLMKHAQTSYSSDASVLHSALTSKDIKFRIEDLDKEGKLIPNKGAGPGSEASEGSHGSQ